MANRDQMKALIRASKPKLLYHLQKALNANRQRHGYAEMTGEASIMFEAEQLADMIIATQCNMIDLAE